jgi:RNA polymerase sigma-70 factor (ECF subfamily)
MVTSRHQLHRVGMQGEDRSRTSFPTPAQFEAVYRAHFRFVWRILARMGVRDADLKDMTQNVFLVVHRQLAGFEGRSELTTWLYSICRLVAKDYRRSATFRLEVVADVREIAELQPSSDGTLSRLDSQRLSEILELILSRLPDKLRIVFEMFELDDMSGEEIARLLNLPEGTVRSRLRLARRAFRRKAKLFVESEAGSPLALGLLPSLGEP